MFYENWEMMQNLWVAFSVISFWSDDSKYVGEDEIALLYIINKMKNSFYKNELKGAFIYWVTG